MAKKKSSVGIRPSEFTSNFGDFVRESYSKDIKPKPLTHSNRDGLRVSQGDTISGLPLAVDAVKTFYRMTTFAETLQFLTVKVLEQATNNPIVKDCVKEYEGGMSRAQDSEIYEGIRSRGGSYSVLNKAERPMTIWAFNDKTADELGGVASKVGMYCNQFVQVFLCGVLITICREALTERQIAALYKEYRRGVMRIVLYLYILKFDEKSVIM